MAVPIETKQVTLKSVINICGHFGVYAFSHSLLLHELLLSLVNVNQVGDIFLEIGKQNATQNN